MISLLINDFKRLKNVIIIYVIALSLNLLISCFSQTPEVTVCLFYLLVFIFSLIVPLVNLNYLFDATKETHFNSLPFTKLNSFILRYISGFICLFAPLILYSVIDGLFGSGLVIKHSMVFVLIILIYYSLTMLTTYLTTTLMMDLVMMTTIIIIPVVLYYSLFVVYINFINGIVSASMSSEVISFLFPIYSLIVGSSEGVATYQLVSYLGYAILLVILALFACLKRQRANSYQGMVFKLVGQVIKLVIIVSLSLVLTAFLGTSSGSVRTFILMNVIATLVVTFIIQFIESKKIRYGLCLIEATAVILTSLVVFTVSKHYLENYIPRNIAAVAIYHVAEDGTNQELKVSDQKAIDQVVNIHQQLMKDSVSSSAISVYLSYYKDNGSKTTRGYYITEHEYEALAKQITGSLAKSWNARYYQVSKELNKATQLSYNYFEGNLHEVTNASDIKLFNSVLKQKLELVESGELALKFNGITGRGAVFITREEIESSYVFYQDDLMDQVIDEYSKIKAN